MEAGVMERKIAAVVASLIIASLVFSVYQPTDAIKYSGHDGSVDKNLEKVLVKPYKGKKDLWTYRVKLCATDYTMGISGFILKSDIDTKVLSGYKNLPKGQCMHAGAVMKAKDGNTLGAEVIERHEALNRYIELSNSIPDLPMNQIKQVKKDMAFYRMMLNELV